MRSAEDEAGRFLVAALSVTALAACVVGYSSLRADTVKFTAEGGGFYVVYSDTDPPSRISQHSSERKAAESMANWLLSNEGTAFYVHEGADGKPYKVRGSATVSPRPPPDPPDPPAPSVGWTDLTPPAGAEVVEVSTGEQLQTALNTIAHGGYVHLKRGSVFNGPFVIRRADLTICPTGTGPLPVIRGSGLQSGDPLGDVRIAGIEFVAGERDAANLNPSGIRITGPTGLHSSVLIEGCRLSGHAMGITLMGVEDATVRRCVVFSTYSLTKPDGTRPHSQGLYTSRTKRMVLAESMFDQNGYSLDPAEVARGGEATIYNHAAYWSSGNADIQVVGCVVSRPSSHGLKINSHAFTVADSVFYRCAAIAIQGGEVVKQTGEARGSIDRVLILGSRDISDIQVRAARQHGAGVSVSHPVAFAVSDTITASPHATPARVILARGDRGESISVTGLSLVNWPTEASVFELSDTAAGFAATQNGTARHTMPGFVDAVIGSELELVESIRSMNYDNWLDDYHQTLYDAARAALDN